MQFQIQIEVEYVPIETEAQWLAWRQSVRWLWELSAMCQVPPFDGAQGKGAECQVASEAISDGTPGQRSVANVQLIGQ